MYLDFNNINNTAAWPLSKIQKEVISSVFMVHLSFSIKFYLLIYIDSKIRLFKKDDTKIRKKPFVSEPNALTTTGMNIPQDGRIVSVRYFPELLFGGNKISNLIINNKKIFIIIILAFSQTQNFYLMRNLINIILIKDKFFYIISIVLFYLYTTR
ncbi:hypothetical protein BpHYR1_015018 [Brachionus plicatilis]|uniref:Uncharacterized protein n=1 Tax=Brachionus plicatilis TaxID=10195 RepID=A0A3M7T4I8_BRAPC|nr:hypothetical protein BpHYR1_015018 [Brachionus plicatilis]